VIAEAPPLSPHARAIRERLAEILGVEPGRISVRGTSSNGLGFAGRDEGIAAFAVVLLEDA
jgi:2-C-methyl-D-erythritol 2,4-cyclodiphosphate synthase